MKLNRIALVWALVVAVLLGYDAWLWLGKRVVPDTDILALLPVQERDPVLQRSFGHMVEASQQQVVVLVGASRWEDAVRAAEAYRAVMRAAPAVVSETAGAGSAAEDWLAPFRAHSLVLMGTAQEARLRSEGVAEWQQAAQAQLYGGFGGPKLGAWRDDPFGLFAGWVEERARETPVRPRDGFLYVGDGKAEYVLLPFTLKQPAFSISAQEAALPLLERAAAAARQAVPGADIVPAGVVLHAGEAGKMAQSEMSTIGVGSVIGIILLAWFTFRSVRPIVLVMTSVVIGVAGAFALCWLLFGRVHLMTLVFGASLIGVAQDYGIYFLCNRLTADRELGSPALVRRLLPGLSLTLLSAVIGYMALAVTPFPGLREMAVFSAAGLVFAWITVVAWFPAFVGPDTLGRTTMAARYVALLSHWPRVRANAATFAVLGVVGALVAVGVARLGTNDDIRLLQSSPKHLVDAQIKLGKLLDIASPVQYFLVRGESDEQVLQREEALKQRLDGLVDKSVLTGYQAISNWVPSLARQQERRALVEQRLLGKGGALEGVAREVGEDTAWVAATANHLRDNGVELTVDGFMQSKASEPWRHLWIGREHGVVASIVALRGLGHAGLTQVQQAASGLPGVQWVDKVGEISSVLGRYRGYMGYVLLAAYGLIFAVLVPRYRGRAWRVLAPIAMAAACTLGLLGWLGHSLQLFHVLALLLLLGVGVDYGIFMQEQRGQDSAGPWLSVGLSAASTILSFGLLGLSRTPALQAFGLTMLAGITLVWFLVPLFRMEAR